MLRWPVKITWRGEILPISGLKEKLRAAKRGSIRIVLISDENQKNLPSIPDNIKNNFDIQPTRQMDRTSIWTISTTDANATSSHPWWNQLEIGRVSQLQNKPAYKLTNYVTMTEVLQQWKHN